MNIQNVIDAAMSIASGMGIDSHNSAVADNEMTAEDLLPLAFRHVYLDLIKTNPARRQDLLKTHEIGLIEGEGDFPDNIITEYTEEAFLPDFKYSAFVKNFMDYKRQKFSNLLCYWTESHGRFFTTCTSLTSSEEDSGSEESGSGSEEADETITLSALTFPTLPASVTDPIIVDPRDLEQIIYTLALAIRGDLKLSSE